MEYDLFISYRSTDANLANKIREELLKIDSSLSIFWSEKTLNEIGKSDYTEAIENAISQSRNMVVVGSSVDNITSKWVSYEWRLFKHLQLNDKENYHRNLFLAISFSDLSSLPMVLQLCECIPANDVLTIYRYTKSEDDLQESYIERKGVEVIHEILGDMGWTNSLFLSPQMLSDYEESLSQKLKTVTIISHSLSQDSPGGALFDTVEANLLNGVKYDYIFLDVANAYGVLRKIRNGHSDLAKSNLTLEIAEETFWALGTFANVTIYEFSGSRSSEGYLRVSVETGDGCVPIYLRMSEEFVDTVWNNIERFRLKEMIKEYGA